MSAANANAANTPSPQLTPNANPLLIGEIANHIFSYLDSCTDLESCFDVCQLWSGLIPTHNIRLRSSRPPIVIKDDMSDTAIHSTYLTSISKHPSFKATKFIFQNVDLTSSAVKKFLGEHGEEMEVLELELELRCGDKTSSAMSDGNSHLSHVSTLSTPDLKILLTETVPNLKTLIIPSLKESGALFLVTLPRMAQLKELKFRGKVLGPDEIQFDGLNFMDTFPHLRKFSYDNDIEEGVFEMSPSPPLEGALGRFHHPGVTYLNLISILSRRIWTYTAFTKFQDIFPSLTHLELNFPSYILDPTVNKTGTWIISCVLSKIWTTWPALSVIHMTFAVDGMELIWNLDEFVTGIEHFRMDRLDFKHGETLRHYDKLNVDKLRQIASEYKTWPGISDLKHLRELSIFFEGQSFQKRGPLRLSLNGIYFGIALASPTLQRVVIVPTVDTNRNKDLPRWCRMWEHGLQLIRATLGKSAVIQL